MTETTKKQPKRIIDVDALEPSFATQVRALLQTLKEEGLPVEVFETRRSLERQAWLHGEGVSRAAGVGGPHVHGLAVDIVLDVEHHYWGMHGCMPVVVGDAGAPWDTGVELRNGRCVLVRAGVAEVVATLGAVATSMGFEWGGTNAGPWRSSRPGDLFGWDHCHFQRARWRSFVPALADPKTQAGSQ